jgi:hypothetical protein
MRISRLVIPQRTDALIVIATHMSALPIGVLTESRRAEIVRNLFDPMLLLIDALQSVSEAGPEEEAVVMHFIGSVHAQSELTKRNHYLDQLLGKLQGGRLTGQRRS